MKVLILAGGTGTRISEESQIIPKPMIEIGGMPIIWHIMKHYSSFGYNEFVVLCGYKSNVIKSYFANYWLSNSSATFDLGNNSAEYFNHQSSENWKVTCLETGLHTNTAGRIKFAQTIVGDSPFFLTYGDGLSNVPIDVLLESHINSGKTLTMTTVQPAGRFGRVELNDQGSVLDFMEKPKGDGGWINGGFFVCEPEFFDYLGNDLNEGLEASPMTKLVRNNQVHAFRHHGFWKCMDTLADKIALNQMWNSDEATWKSW